MITVSINTPVRHNFISEKYYQDNKILVLIPTGTRSDLSNHVINNAIDIIEFVDIYHIKKELEENNYISKKMKIFSVSEDFMYTAALLREHFNISGMNHEETIAFRDKTIMKKMVNNKGIRVPKFNSYISSYSFNDIVNSVGIPFVLKPIDAAGSIGVYIIENISQFEKANLEILDSSNYEFEEYIKGTLYHVDILLQNDTVIFESACEYSLPNLEFANGKHFSSLILDDNCTVSKRLRPFARSAVSALGLKNGPSHIEIFISNNDELVFLEAACRTPGASVVPMYEKQFGFNMIEESLNIELNKPVNEINLVSDINLFSGVFPLRSGTVKKINTPLLTSKIEMTTNCNIGSRYETSDSLKSIGGNFFVKNTNMEELRHDFENLREHQFIDVF